MQRRSAPGKPPRDPEIETAPKEMHGAALPDEAGAEEFEDPIGLKQDTPETVCVFGIVGTMLSMPIERKRVINFVRQEVDRDWQLQFRQRPHHQRVEFSDRLRSQFDHPPAPSLFGMRR